MLDQVNEIHTNPLQDNILYYISGYIVKALLKEESCQECKTELLDESSDTVSNAPYSKFQKVKGRGGLKHASPTVLKLSRLLKENFENKSLNMKKELTLTKTLI